MDTAPGGKGDFRMRVPAAVAGVGNLGEVANDQSVQGFYVQSDCMAPRYLFGELVLVGGRRRAKVGDHVLVVLRHRSASDGMADCFLRKLSEIKGSRYVLTQYNPATPGDAVTEIEADEVEQLARVLAVEDLVNFD